MFPNLLLPNSSRDPSFIAKYFVKEVFWQVVVFLFNFVNLLLFKITLNLSKNHLSRKIKHLNDCRFEIFVVYGDCTFHVFLAFLEDIKKHTSFLLIIS